MDNNNVLNYTNCCSRLAKFAASKRTSHKSESSFRLNKKESKQNESAETVLKEAKIKNKMVPFICAGSASKSHHIGINIQTTMSMIKQFRGLTFDEHVYSMNSSSSNVLSDTRINKGSGTSISQLSSGMKTCPSKCDGRITIQENETFDGTNPNPWSVKQSDSDAFQAGCCPQKYSCSCITRAMDSYSKVMAPFIKREVKHSFEMTKNPYTKEKLVKYYELLAMRTQELKQTVVALSYQFSQLREKFNKLNEQYERTQNSNLVPILLKIEGELNALKSKSEEAIDVYKEAVFMNSQESSNSAAALLADIEPDDDPKPRETTAVRLARVLRKVQSLQHELKTGHLTHGNDDQI